MQFRQQPINESNFIGYNNNLPAQMLPPGYFVTANNVTASDGKIAKVTGTTALGASIAARAFNGITAYENITAGTKYIVVNIDGASNAQLYQSTGGNFSAIGSANITNGKSMMFEVANNVLYGVNGSDEVDWDGSSYSHNRSGFPLGNYLAWFHNYLFVANSTANPSRLFWSNLGDPTTFSGSNFVDVNPGDSDQIMGLGKFQDELIVFKKNTIWAISGFSGTSFSSTTIATQNTNARIFGYGCISPRSIVPVGNDIYYLSMVGGIPVIRSLYLTSFAKVLGGGVMTDDITGTMQSINKTSLSTVAGGFDGRYAYWAIPTGSNTFNDTLIVLDTWKIIKNKIYPWTTQTGKTVHAFATSTIPGYPNLYYADDTQPTTGLVFKFDSSVYTNNGVNITMNVVTRNFMPDPAREFKYKYLYLKYDSGTPNMLTINAKVDNSATYTLEKSLSLGGLSPGLGPTGSFTLGVSVLGGATISSSRITLLHSTGKLIQFQFTESSANAVGIYDHQLYFIPKGLRNS